MWERRATVASWERGHAFASPGQALAAPVGSSTGAAPRDCMPRSQWAFPNTRPVSTLARLGIGVAALGHDEDGGSSLLGHDAVVGVPVVVGAAGGREDIAEQNTERFA